MADTLYDVTSGFYDSINQDRLYSADQMNMPYKRLISEGVFATPTGTASTDFQVLAVSGRNVKVCAGNAILGEKWVESTADQPITIEGNSSGNPRIDAIVLRVDRNNAERKASIIYRTGTAAASPTAPALNTGSNIYELRLADILVASGTSTISQSAITDQRGSAECPWITSLLYQVDTSTLFEQYKSAWADFIATLDRQDTSGVESRTGSATTVSGLSSYPMKTAFGITDYDPTGDIIMLYINGLYAIEGDKWDLVPQTDPTNPNITLQNETAAGQHLYMVVLKPVAPVPSSGSGLTEDIKVALLDCFDHVAWTVDNGQDYVDALEAALYPPANLVSISAVYTQSGTVYDTDSLDDLKADLVVTAHYDDSSTETVTTYTLSGTLAEGTSTITVAYGGKTTTFTVTVTHAVQQYTITNNLIDVTNSNLATVINELTAYTATLSVESGYIMSSVNITMGNTDITEIAYDSETGTISISSVTGNIVITAEAIEDVGWISGVAYDLTEYPNVSGKQVTLSGYESSSNHTATAMLPCHGANAMYSPDGSPDKFVRYGQDGTAIDTTVTTMNSTWGSQRWMPVTASAYFFAFSGYTSNLTLTSKAIPYELEVLGENTPVEAGEHYAINSGDESYMFCYGMNTLKLSVPARRKIDFYDGNKQYLSTTGAQNNLVTVTIPENAVYFKFDSGYGIYQNIAWFLAE